ncbi:pyridoxamine kinase/phosphomethylpyrimidine kinase [Lucifera butyrica]|uniref:pyridoxal kinase n=2 Tax=Lucifera butyrica TaxID=1351585 RepID=A0A498R9D4_9FIRM|nr:pyridoxamine kinase/phosphomethylpyrimidine kinase [Lucifera butyrica]
MQHSVPRVAAVHDISCFGRCSLTVIMPVLASMGIQACPLPTAVLSTHLGGFADWEFCDFTERMPAFLAHWKKEGVFFDCIYSGFLASQQQIEIVERFISEFSRNRPLIVVDPVMGDEGRLYTTYTPAMQKKMKALVRKADVITPNYTEACFLLGESYQDKVLQLDRVRDWLPRLAEFGPAKVVITGIPCYDEKIMNLGYERERNVFWEVSADWIPVRYPGTGDIFASVLLGCLLRREDLLQAITKASDFVALAVKTTFQAGMPVREGVLLEKVLPFLYP